jgi:hypothetical protein
MDISRTNMCMTRGFCGENRGHTVVGEKYQGVMGVFSTGNENGVYETKKEIQGGLRFSTYPHS